MHPGYLTWRYFLSDSEFFNTFDWSFLFIGLWFLNFFAAAPPYVLIYTAWTFHCNDLKCIIFLHLFSVTFSQCFIINVKTERPRRGPLPHVGNPGSPQILPQILLFVHRWSQTCDISLKQLWMNPELKKNQTSARVDCVFSDWSRGRWRSSSEITESGTSGTSVL